MLSSIIEGAKNTDTFLSLWEHAKEKCDALQLSPLTVSCPRKLSLKLGAGDKHNSSDIQEKLRILYFEVPGSGSNSKQL